MPRPAIRLELDSAGQAGPGESGLSDHPVTSSAITTSQPAMRLWPVWTMLVIFAFMGFECLLLGAALKGPWLILMAPGLVCAFKAYETWRELTVRMNRRDHKAEL